MSTHWGNPPYEPQIPLSSSHAVLAAVAIGSGEEQAKQLQLCLVSSVPLARPSTYLGLTI